MMVISFITICGILVQLSKATNEDIMDEYYESLAACLKPENHDNVEHYIDEWLEYFTDDMEYCEGETEYKSSDALCYDKSGLKVKMVESIDKIYDEYAPESFQYAYTVGYVYGIMTNEYELMLSSKTCIVILKESHKFTFENDKIKEVYKYDMEYEEDCIPTTTKDTDICLLPKVTGNCRGYFPRWYYNGEECEEFTYGGCGGNKNNFESLAECELYCDKKATTKKPETTDYEDYVYKGTTKKPTKQTTWYKDTESPTKSPTYKPTNKPTYKPTEKPTEWPTKAPTYKPTAKPTYAPTKKPTTPKPTTAKPTMWEKTTKEPTAWKKETEEPTVWAKTTNKPSSAPTKKDEY